MKNAFARLGAILALALFAMTSISAQDRKAWSSVEAPVITGIDKISDNEYKVSFTCVTNNDGSDEGVVTLKSDTGVSLKSVFGKTRKANKEAVFKLTQSGVYTVVVEAKRKTESEVHKSAPKTIKYVLALGKPTVTALNIGKGEVEVSWTAIDEADGYILSYTDDNGKTVSQPSTKELSSKIQLKAGTKTTLKVTVTRGSDKSVSDPIKKSVTDLAERVWAFTEFGTSTNPSRNTMEMIDPDKLTVKLNSCIFDPKTGTIIEKGGKFETFFDGISFYYTAVDPYKENFELTATVTVDYHNPSADGQEGFGLLALDRLGVDGQSMVIAYNNSAGIISRKYTTHVNGVKKEIKNGLGSRFVSGLTDAIIEGGDSEISSKATSISKAFSYDQASDAIKTGDVYRITLKKDNTGYHAIYKRAIASEDTVEEFIMYDSENKKLTQLDKDHIYVGFAVARGCNATFSDVVFNVTDPKKDPPPTEEPPELVPLTTLIDCPSTWYNTKYPFVFTSNTKGTVTVKDNDGKVLLKESEVEANVDFKKTLKIKNGINDLVVTFTPEEGWAPAPKAVVAQYDANLGEYVKDYKAVTYTHSIISKAIKGKKIYVTQKGDVFGDGTKESPVDLESAIQYSKPGQTILLAGGRYYLTKSLLISRGNDGTPSARKVLMSEDPNNRAIIDFSSAKMSTSGVNLYGSYWTIKNIDVTLTPDDCKGIQVAGNYNQLMMVDAYLNGDTGIQISGRSSEPFEKWPHDNLIYGCESFGNSDPAQNNADGFASKLTTGNGNVFRNCVAHHNVDDGWDLYSKVETGPIGAVVIDNCIVYANGTKLDGSGKGDGNGFKLGGDGIGIKHLLKDSLSWENGVNGITSNSNPALILERVTAFGNGAYNISLYGKGKAEDNPRHFKASGVLSLQGGMADKYDEQPKLLSDVNYFFNGAKASNAKEAILEKDSFVSVDMTPWKKGYKDDGKTFNRIPRDENGVFQLGDLFKLTDKVPEGIGANYNGTTFEMPKAPINKTPFIIAAIVVLLLASCGTFVFLKKKNNK